MMVDCVQSKRLRRLFSVWFTVFSIGSIETSLFLSRYKSNEDYVYVRGRGRGKYICEECGIRCKKPSMLKKHIRTHTDVRPYICRVCNFAFKTKGEHIFLSSTVSPKSFFRCYIYHLSSLYSRCSTFTPPPPKKTPKNSSNMRTNQMCSVLILHVNLLLPWWWWWWSYWHGLTENIQ